MDVDQIKELMGVVERSKIRKLHMKKGDFELQIEKEAEPLPAAALPPLYYPPRAAAAEASEAVFHSDQLAKTEKGGKRTAETSADGKFITSPMVGTFYAAPAPDQPPFVKVGDKVDENTVVCIVEAMKVMNEVKANMSGTVAEVLVETAHPVEFGSRIFRVV